MDTHQIFRPASRPAPAVLRQVQARIARRFLPATASPASAPDVPDGGWLNKSRRIGGRVAVRLTGAARPRWTF